MTRRGGLVSGNPGPTDGLAGLLSLLVLGGAALLFGPAPSRAASLPQETPSNASEPIPVAEARLDGDGDGEPDRRGDTLTVAGRATIGNATLDQLQTRLFIQDGSGGLLLYSTRSGAPVEPGDSVEAWGVMSLYRGHTQMQLIGYRVVPAEPRLPEPVALPADVAAFEAYEGSLIRARAFVKAFGSNEGGRSLRLGPANTSEPLFSVFVSRNHADPPDLDRFSVGDEVEVTGLLGQYDVETPYDSFYEVYPRQSADLAAVALPRRLQQRVLQWTFVLLAMAGMGILLLRRQVNLRTQALVASERSERESRERLTLLLDHAPAVLWTVDRDLRFTWAEGRELAELGMARHDPVGSSVTEVFGTGDPDSPQLRAYQEALQGRPAQFDHEWNGRTWQVRLHALEEDGVITGIVGAALDATRHREIEARLEEQRAHLQKLFDESPEAIVLVDEEDRILEVNPEFSEMFGYTSGEALGRSVNELLSLPGRESEPRELTERVARGERIEVETVRRHKDGTPIDVSILATQLEVGGRRLVYGIYRDITEQKALEAQLLHSQRLEAVGQLAGGVAHDFNNILTAILGHTRVLLDELNGDPGLRSDVEQIEAAGERAARLTRQLLTFSRRDMVSPRSVDLNVVVREAQDFLARLIEERVELSLRLAPDLPPVHADPRQLEQIVMNLVINARDAMPGGGRVTVSTRREHSQDEPAVEPGAPDAGRVVLEIRDEGRGMQPDEKARMFEPFFTTKRPGEGTGLGLSTVYGIVEQAGGEIEVESAPLEGTTVRIFLPTDPGDREGWASDAGTAHGEDRGSDPGRGEVILLVDDDRAVRDVTRRILERAGYRVVTAASGPAALEYCERTEVVPDAVVTDIVMPGMDGYDLVERLRRRFPHIRVLLMTGYTEKGPVEHTEILRKPFDAATLVRRVREELVRS